MGGLKRLEEPKWCVRGRNDSLPQSEALQPWLRGYRLGPESQCLLQTSPGERLRRGVRGTACFLLTYKEFEGTSSVSWDCKAGIQGPAGKLLAFWVRRLWAPGDGDGFPSLASSRKPCAAPAREMVRPLPLGSPAEEKGKDFNPTLLAAGVEAAATPEGGTERLTAKDRLKKTLEKPDIKPRSPA